MLFPVFACTSLRGQRKYQTGALAQRAQQSGDPLGVVPGDHRPDVRQGVETAVRVAGTGLGGVRLDSGDLPALVRLAVRNLDAFDAGVRATAVLSRWAARLRRGFPIGSMNFRFGSI